MTIYLLDDRLLFPSPGNAEADGALAIGGDLSVKRLGLAYCSGIFPWYNKGQPIIWWSPDPRFVLFPNQFKLRRSLRKVINKGKFEVRWDTAFEQVIRYCSALPRPGQNGTWIQEEMVEAYCKLQQTGLAHSIECWLDNRLVGGLYGVAIGPFFFGESMFHTESDASKVALAALVTRYPNAPFIDCQIHSDLFESLGATHIPREQFLATLSAHLQEPNNWEQTAGDYSAGNS